MKTLLLIVLVSLTAWAQKGPSVVATRELDGDNLARLGAQILWPSMPGYSFSVYAKEDTPQDGIAGYGACPTTGIVPSQWIELTTTHLVNNPSGNAYSTFPPLEDQYGSGGSWCYGVTATDVTTGIESPIIAAPERIGLGQYYYFIWYLTNDPVGCTNRYTPPLPDGTATIMRTRNGVAEPIPMHNNGEHNGQALFWRYFRVLSKDTVSVNLALPDGKLLTFDEAVGSVLNPDTRRNYVHFFEVVLNKGSETVCMTDHQERFREASGGN